MIEKWLDKTDYDYYTKDIDSDQINDYIDNLILYLSNKRQNKIRRLNVEYELLSDKN